MTPTPIPTLPISTESAEMAASLLGAGFIGILWATFLSGVIWLIALIDILKATFKDSNNKLIWVLITFFIPFLGPLLYFLVGRKQINPNTGLPLKGIFTILFLFVFSPVGVIMMWVWTKWPAWAKWIITILALLQLVVPFVAGMLS